MKELLEAIKYVREKSGPMVKDNKVSFGKTRYKFFDINQMIDKMQPHLDEMGLVVYTQVLENSVRTTAHHLKSGSDIASEIPLHEKDPQKIGSEITYYRRYNLQALFNFQTEDDDAVTTRPDYKKQEQTQAKASPPPKKSKDELTPKHPNWDKVVKALSEDKIKSRDQIEKFYTISQDVLEKLERDSNKILL